MTVLNLQVSQGSDDGHERDDTNGPFFTLNEILFADFSTVRLTTLCRFLNVTIPPGAGINSATFTVMNQGLGGGDDADGSVYCEDTDNSPAMTTTDTDVTGRTLTTASVSWLDLNIGVGNPSSPPDMASVIQEVVDRAGWASGNALSVIAVPNNNARILNFEPYEVSTANAAKLDIDYSPAGFAHSQAVIIG